MYQAQQPDGSIKVYIDAQEAQACPEGYSEVCGAPWWSRVGGNCVRFTACVCCLTGGPPVACQEKLGRLVGEAKEAFPPDESCP